MSGNTDKAAGMANEAAGQIKQGVGKAVGSEKLQGECAGQELKGDAQQVKGDTKNAMASTNWLTQRTRSFDRLGNDGSARNGRPFCTHIQLGFYAA